MAAMRLNIPAVFVSGGPMEAGKVNGENADLITAMIKGGDPTVSDEELNAQVTGMSRDYGYKPNALRETLRKSGAIEYLRFDILSAKALDKLVAKVLA